MTPRPERPATTSGRALLAKWKHGWDYMDEMEVAAQMALGILAIEAEAAAAAVWERLEATPGFNEELAQGEADIAAGKGTPFHAAAALPDVAELAAALHATYYRGREADDPLSEWEQDLDNSVEWYRSPNEMAEDILTEIERARGDSK